MKIHKLESGATVITTSPHGFKFSDGTVAEPQTKEICDRLTLFKSFNRVNTIRGMALCETRMCISDGQSHFLHNLCEKADLVILPFPVLSALRDMGIRDQFPNAVAFNATAETQRSAPTDKVVDINNWSY